MLTCSQDHRHCISCCFIKAPKILYIFRGLTKMSNLEFRIITINWTILSYVNVKSLGKPELRSATSFTIECIWSRAVQINYVFLITSQREKCYSSRAHELNFLVYPRIVCEPVSNNGICLNYSPRCKYEQYGWRLFFFFCHYMSIHMAAVTVCSNNE